MPAGGIPWTVPALEDLAWAAGDLPIHMDGARLFNAEVATGTEAAAFTGPVTTVMTCLSKGLCAPVGSVLAGPLDVMAAGRIERHRLGGAMRQAGVIAAAGLVGLRTMVERLDDDHRRANRLAHAVAERWPASGCDPSRLPTNMVIFHHPDPATLLEKLRADGVLAGTLAPGIVRFVTHHDVDDAGLEKALKAISAAD